MRYTPDVGPLVDDYSPEEHDDHPLEELDASDVTSIATASEDDGSDTDLSGFVVDDDEATDADSPPAAEDETEEEEEEWESGSGSGEDSYDSEASDDSEDTSTRGHDVK